MSFSRHFSASTEPTEDRPLQASLMTQSTRVHGTSPAAPPQPPHGVAPAQLRQRENTPERIVRARIDPSVRNQGVDSHLSLLAAAEKFIKSHTESLQEGIATFLLSRGKEYLLLFHRLKIKLKSLHRMESDDSFIPVSARVSFKLQVIKEAAEVQEFKDLQTTVKVVVDAHQQELKRHIILSLKIEIKMLYKELDKHLINTLNETVTLFNIANGNLAAPSNVIAYALLLNNYEMLTKHLTSTRDDFMTKASTILLITADHHRQIAELDLQQTSTIKRTIDSIFVSSIDFYLHQLKQREMNLALNKKAKEQLQLRKTEDAVMEVDQGLPVPPEQLKELIRKEAKVMAAKFARDEVERQLGKSAKKSKRGQIKANTGASQKNKSTAKEKSNAKNQKENQTPQTSTDRKKSSKGRNTSSRDRDSASGDDSSKGDTQSSSKKSSRKKRNSNKRNSRS